ncbi:MAG TPA: hypothetical protein VFT74_15490 [Isosphaeraceae bacterium]|nr:hypothetical protein [Isosphaeraceae bacterium]
MDRPDNLIAYGNTYNPSLLILQEKGYQISAEEGENSMTGYALKDSVTLTACSPPELLGLATLWECFGETWNRQEPGLLEKVLDDSIPD